MSKTIALDEHTAAHLAELFGAFSDASRVQIISALAQTEQNVGNVAKAVGLSQPAVSHHLRALRQLRLVTVRKVGRQVFYSLDEHVADLFRHGLDHVQNPRRNRPQSGLSDRIPVTLANKDKPTNNCQTLNARFSLPTRRRATCPRIPTKV